jgi:pimeloyl-ACP methyl ester carboxylesterase
MVGRLASTIGLVGLVMGVADRSAATPRSRARSPAPAVACFRGPIQPFRDCDRIQFSWMQGFDDPATPDDLDRVGVLKVGSPDARNVLVLVPGTSAGAGYFEPLAEDIVDRTQGRWQVWSVERRENQLEDHSLLDALKQGGATSQELFDYYLGWLIDPSVTSHFQLVPDASVAFARGWGMNVAIQDLHRVVEAAGRRGRRVVLGGHSLGGSITTAYATWDFDGKAGAKDLDGLVYIDGGSNPVPISEDQATQSLQSLQNGSPWLVFGGIPTPFLGLYSAAGSCGAAFDPDDPSLGFTFPLLPSNLKPSLPAGVVPTNEAEFGFGVDTDTSPASLIAAQVHAGHLADSGNPRGWVDDGITPIQRYAAMLCGSELVGHDGSAWYHPLRLTIDSGAVADGNANSAQDILDVHAIHGADLGKHMPIYAFGAALGGDGVLLTARVLAEQSGIRESELTLVNRQGGYSHNDPAGASPDNAFLEHLIPFLEKIDRGERRHGSRRH